MEGNWLSDAMKLTPFPEGTACAVGVVLYSNRHANVARALKSGEFWRKITAESGAKWALFAIREGALFRSLSPPFPVFTATLTVSIDLNPVHNESIAKFLQLPSEYYFPCVAVFAIGDDEEVFVAHARIKDATQDLAEDSLSEIIRAVSEAVDGVAAENLGNARGLMTAIGYRLSELRDIRVLRNGWRVAKELRAWLKLRPSA